MGNEWCSIASLVPNHFYYYSHEDETLEVRILGTFDSLCTTNVALIPHDKNTFSSDGGDLNVQASFLQLFYSSTSAGGQNKQTAYKSSINYIKMLSLVVMSIRILTLPFT